MPVQGQKTGDFLSNIACFVQKWAFLSGSSHFHLKTGLFRLSLYKIPFNFFSLPSISACMSVLLQHIYLGAFSDNYIEKYSFICLQGAFILNVLNRQQPSRALIRQAKLPAGNF